jgi:hypothetical protein
LALVALIVVMVTARWIIQRDLRRGYTSTRGATVVG